MRLSKTASFFLYKAVRFAVGKKVLNKVSELVSMFFTEPDTKEGEVEKHDQIKALLNALSDDVGQALRLMSQFFIGLLIESAYQYLVNRPNQVDRFLK